jgi:hypothetical protein
MFKIYLCWLKMHDTPQKKKKKKKEHSWESPEFTLKMILKYKNASHPVFIHESHL